VPLVPEHELMAVQREYWAVAWPRIPCGLELTTSFTAWALWPGHPAGRYGSMSSMTTSTSLTRALPACNHFELECDHDLMCNGVCKDISRGMVRSGPWIFSPRHTIPCLGWRPTS